MSQGQVVPNVGSHHAPVSVVRHVEDIRNGDFLGSCCLLTDLQHPLQGESLGVVQLGEDSSQGVEFGKESAVHHVSGNRSLIDLQHFSFHFFRVCDLGLDLGLDVLIFAGR